MKKESKKGYPVYDFPSILVRVKAQAENQQRSLNGQLVKYIRDGLEKDEAANGK